ncbi:MAG: phosphate ABC transporter ATP-binding protein, partial [Nocardioidaceae bacterium]
MTFVGTTSTRPETARRAPQALADAHADANRAVPDKPDPVMEALALDAYYGSFKAVHNVNLSFGKNEITALIGPSGCGKSTVLRCLNRMNDLIPDARVEGEINYHGVNIYARNVDPIELRRRIGMVFQKPNPFPKSIYDNIAYGPRVTGMKVASMDDLVEEALRSAALWDEVKDKLKNGAYSLSGGQQQRLCIAR